MNINLSFIFEILAAVCTITSVYYIAKPKLFGQYLMFISNTMWVIFSILNGHIFLLFQNIILLILTIIAIINWKRKGIY